MDEVQFNNWKQTVEETLARITVLQERAAEKAVEQTEAANRRMARVERDIALLARLGRKARSRINGTLEEHDARMAKMEQEHQDRQAKIEQNLMEITDKLNGLIGYVQGQTPPPQ